MFTGRSLIIATKHQKENIIAPLLEKEIGVKCFVSNELDTDLFGTFTGEVARLNDPIETARQKCLKAIEISGCNLAIASEGSFGPHPSLAFLNVDSEIIFMLDKKNNAEYISHHISTETNFNASVINNRTELDDFLELAKFPSHAVIFRKSKNDNEDIFKEIVDLKSVDSHFDYLIKKYNSFFAETDMRAMFNPTRQKVIEETTIKLIEKLKSHCPNCNQAGFSVIRHIPGLKCSNCGSPTKSTKAYIYACQFCHHQLEKSIHKEHLFEDPMYCDFCNP